MANGQQSKVSGPEAGDARGSRHGLATDGRAAPYLAISLLGPVRIEVGGLPLAALRSDKARALLAYLATEQGRPHRRATLAALLWPDRDEPAARHDLSQALWTLQRAIGDQATGLGQTGDPVFELTRDIVALAAAAQRRVDVAAFVAALEACDRHRHRVAAGCDRCGRLRTEAVARYRGDFLSDLAVPDSAPFEDWAASTRSALRQRALAALEALADWHGRRGDGDAVVGACRRLLELEPWHEGGHRRLVRALAERGRRGDALAEHERFRGLLARELGAAPEPETSALIEAIRRGSLAPRPAAHQARPARPAPRLPTPPGPLIARERELGALAALLAAPACRLVTLVGPGGVGKTRLALQAATDAATSFASGAYLVSLAPLQSAGRLAPAIAVALGLDLSGAPSPEERLLDELADREALLVLDNFDRLVEGGAALVAAILRRAPGVKVLVTSRERLRLRDEWRYDVEGLSVPEGEDGAAVARSGAARFFVASALKAKAELALRAEDWSAIARICRLVGGLPLAIELAAAWVAVLPCPDIAREVERNLDFLAAELRDVPARHRSMRAVCDHAWVLLASEQRDVFKRLAVFSGGFDRSAAEAVAGATLATLVALVGRSWVQARPDGRYELHELLRMYGADRLGADEDDARETRARHCDHFCRLVADRAAQLKGRDQASAGEAIGRDLENVREAWYWAAEHGRVERIAESAPGLWLYFAVMGRLWEAERLYGRMVALLEHAPTGSRAPVERRDLALGRALIGRGAVCYRLGRLHEARAALERSAGIFRGLDAPADLGVALHHLAGALHVEGAYEQERILLEESIALLVAAGDRWTAAYSRNDLARVARLQGDLDRAQRLAEESLATLRGFEDHRGVAFALDNLGALAAARGDGTRAARLHHACLALRRAQGDAWGVATTLGELGALARRQGERERAWAFLREAVDTAMANRTPPVALAALTELAALLVEAGDAALAAEVLGEVLRHPRRTSETYRAAAALLAGMPDARASADGDDVPEEEAERALDHLVGRLPKSPPLVQAE